MSQLKQTEGIPLSATLLLYLGPQLIARCPPTLGEHLYSVY